MNHYILISHDEMQALRRYRQQQELERVQRVLRNWERMRADRAVQYWPQKEEKK